MTRGMICRRYFVTDVHPEGHSFNANRWIRKQLKAGRLKQSTGNVPNGDDIEITTVFSTKSISNVQHELALTRMWERYEQYVVDRSPGLNHNADMEMQLGTRNFWIEQDCDTEKKHQVRKRMRSYRALQDNEFVLFVCPSLKRSREILSWGEEISGHLVVTLLEEFLHGSGEILTTFNGTKKCLPL